MKKLDYIVGFIFVLIIGLKFYLFPNVVNNLGIPTGLYSLNILAWIILFVSICFIRFKIKFSKAFILLFILLGHAESFWKFNINDIGLGFLVFRFIGYTFLGFILLNFPKKEGTLERDDNLIEKRS